MTISYDEGHALAATTLISFARHCDFLDVPPRHSITKRFVAVALAALLASASARAATYYIAPTGGSDSGNGAIGTPFATIAHGIAVSQPGDTIYLRGGTFSLSSTLIIGTNRNGTAASPVNLFAYPGDATPVLDFRGETFSGTNSGAVGLDLQANYWHLQGFTVQYAADAGINISGSNNTLNRLVSRQNQDSGFFLKQSSTRIPSNNLILNCDSYANFDFRTDTAPGGNADGFAAKFRDIGPGNYFIGDRAYNNGDDGFDFWGASSPIHVINSQAFHNGVNLVFQNPGGGAIASYSGNANGFKLGQDSSTHTLSGDVAWGNPHNGFDINGNARDTVGPGIIQHGVTIYNTTGFGNGTNYRFDDTFPHVLKNNISLSGSLNVVASNVSDHNSWNTGFSVSTSDFLSTTDPVTDGLFHPQGTGGDRSGTTSPTYPTVPGRNPTTGDILNPTGFLQLKVGDPRIDVGTSSFNDATGTSVTLSSNPTVLNFTGITVTIPGFYGAGPDLGALDVVSSATWSGAIGDGRWSTSGNWNAQPQNGTSLVFAGSGTSPASTNDGSLTSVGSITFNSGAGTFTLGGSGLGATISIAGGIVNNSTNAQTVNLGLSLTAAQQFNAATGNLTVNGAIATGGKTLTVTGSASTTLAGAISGSGALVKSGSGTLTISGSNSFSGGTTVSAGTLIVARSNALGTAGLSITGTSQAQLQAGLTAPVQLASLTISGAAAPALDNDFSSAELLDQPISEPQMMPGSKTEAVPEANAMLLAGQGLCILLFATAAMRLRHVARFFTARLCDATSKSRRASPAAIGAYQHIERP